MGKPAMHKHIGDDLPYPEKRRVGIVNSKHAGCLIKNQGAYKADDIDHQQVFDYWGHACKRGGCITEHIWFSFSSIYAKLWNPVQLWIPFQYWIPFQCWNCPSNSRTVKVRIIGFPCIEVLADSQAKSLSINSAISSWDNSVPALMAALRARLLARFWRLSRVLSGRLFLKSSSNWVIASRSWMPEPRSAGTPSITKVFFPNSRNWNPSAWISGSRPLISAVSAGSRSNVWGNRLCWLVPCRASSCCKNCSYKIRSWAACWSMSIMPE